MSPGGSYEGGAESDAFRGRGVETSAGGANAETETRVEVDEHVEILETLALTRWPLSRTGALGAPSSSRRAPRGARATAMRVSASLPFLGG